MYKFLFPPLSKLPQNQLNDSTCSMDLMKILHNLRELEEIHWVECDEPKPTNIHVDPAWLVCDSLDRLLQLETTIQPNHILNLTALSPCVYLFIYICVCVV